MNRSTLNQVPPPLAGQVLPLPTLNFEPSPGNPALAPGAPLPLPTMNFGGIVEGRDDVSRMSDADWERQRAEEEEQRRLVQEENARRLGVDRRPREAPDMGYPML